MVHEFLHALLLKGPVPPVVMGDVLDDIEHVNLGSVLLRQGFHMGQRLLGYARKVRRPQDFFHFQYEPPFVDVASVNDPEVNTPKPVVKTPA
jgi:hypothetical protein